MAEQVTVEEQWRRWLMGEDHGWKLERGILRLLPHEPRCKVCNAPFKGAGGALMRLTGRRPWTKNPTFCNTCERTLRRFPGGVELPLSLVFADIRGSTTAAERMTAGEFTRILNRFYRTATRTLLRTDAAVIDKFVGDEVIAFYLPLVKEHARIAIEAARDLLRATGHGDADGPWIPVGVGVHTGVAYVGMVGDQEGVNDFTALGDTVNVTARLASQAAAGEVLASEAAVASAGIRADGLEARRLELKGRTEPIGVRVIHAGDQFS